MAAVYVRQRRNRRYREGLPRPRVFRDRYDPLAFDDATLFERYRFRRQSILYLLSGIEEFLLRPTMRNMSLSPLIQLLLCLRYLATGASHILVGDSLNVSENSAGRAIRNVASLIGRVFRHHVSFPTGERALQVMEGFRRVSGFPKVIGCIDGTFIKIKAPSTNEPDYINRKGYHSLNVQMTCDPNFRVTSASINWPGSTHDSRIWRSSGLCSQFEEGIHDGLLLGDSGYPCTKYLMTPFLAPHGEAQERYNRSLCRTRVIIEQTYGIMKRRFQSLHFGLLTNVERAVKYIFAAIVLHNIGIGRGDILITNDVNDFIETDIAHFHIEPRHDGRLRRNDIVSNFFS